MATNAGRADLDEVRGLARTSGPVRDAEGPVWAGSRVHPESVAVLVRYIEDAGSPSTTGRPSGRFARLPVGRAAGYRSAATAAWPRRRSLSARAGARRHWLDPWAYLTHVLTELPARRATADLTDLLPDRWARCPRGAVTVPCDAPARTVPPAAVVAHQRGRGRRVYPGRPAHAQGGRGQSSFRIVPVPRLLVNRALPLSPNKSR